MPMSCSILVSALLGQVQSGALKALAVTGKDRFPAVPNVPAAIESGVLPGYDVTTWYGVFGTPGVPAPARHRETTLSPCIVGVMATRRSISAPPTTIRLRPS
jgi:tripartite-type tricarboxylate transporter receptor subunit TctC